MSEKDSKGESFDYESQISIKKLDKEMPTSWTMVEKKCEFFDDQSQILPEKSEKMAHVVIEKESKCEPFDCESQPFQRMPFYSITIEKAAMFCEFMLIISHFGFVIFYIIEKLKLSNDSINLQPQYNILIGLYFICFIFAFLSIYGIWSRRSQLLLCRLCMSICCSGFLLLVNIASMAEKGFHFFYSINCFVNAALLLFYISSIFLVWKCYNRIKRRKYASYVCEPPPSYSNVPLKV